MNVCVCVLSDESKVFDGAAQLQLDCMVEENSRGAAMKHESLLSLSEDSSAPPQNDPPPSEMSSPLPVESTDTKLELASSDTPPSTGERKPLPQPVCVDQALNLNTVLRFCSGYLCFFSFFSVLHSVFTSKFIFWTVLFVWQK